MAPEQGLTLIKETWIFCESFKLHKSLNWRSLRGLGFSVILLIHKIMPIGAQPRVIFECDLAPEEALYYSSFLFPKLS